jgi:hypothetical protein
LTIVAVNFSAITDVLTIDATTELELYASAWPVFDIAASAIISFDTRMMNGRIKPQRRRFPLDKLSEPGRRGRPVAVATASR